MSKLHLVDSYIAPKMFVNLILINSISVLKDFGIAMSEIVQLFYSAFTLEMTTITINAAINI